MTSKSRTFLILLLSFVMLTVGSVKGQETDVQQKIRVWQRVTDLVVRDRNGNFVTGLKPSDIKLVIDGQAVEVKALEEFRAVQPDDAEVSSYLVKYEEAREQGSTPPAPPVPPRYIVLFFDCFNSGPDSIKEAKGTAQDLIGEVILPFDLVTVFQYDKELKHLVGPTNDMEKILEAIDSVTTFSKNNFYEPQMEEMVPPVHRTDVNYFKTIYQEKQIQYNAYLEALTNTSKAMALLPGRKSFLLFSEGPNIFNPLEVSQQTLMLIKDIQTGIEMDLAEGAEGSLSKLHEVRGYESTSSYSFLGSSQREGIYDLVEDVGDSTSTFFTIRRGKITPQWMESARSSMSMRTDPRMRLVETAQPGFANTRLQNMMQARLTPLKDIAEISGGKFYDAGISRENLFDSLSEEIGNYYELAFTIPEQQIGKFYSIDISIAGHPDYEVNTRKGFLGREATVKTGDEETDMTLESALAGGALSNQLNIDTRFYQLPLTFAYGAIFFAEIDKSTLTPDEQGMVRLDKIVAVEDTEGNVRFRQHMKYDAQANSIPEKLWLAGMVPLASGGSSVSLLVKDENSGLQSLSRRKLETRVSGTTTATLTEPMFLLPTKEGAVHEWHVEEINDNVEVTDPMSFTGFRIPAKPNYKNEFAQGEEATLFCMIANLPEDFDVSTMAPQVDYIIYSGDRRYQLIQSDQKAQYLANSRALAYMAIVPIGLAPEARGELEIRFAGILGEFEMITTVPYSITDFSEQRAVELMDDTKIIDITEK